MRKKWESQQIAHGRAIPTRGAAAGIPVAQARTSSERIPLQKRSEDGRDAESRDLSLHSAVLELSSSRYWAVPRILLDLLVWAGAAYAATATGETWAILLAVAWIGSVPMHDLLVHGHDSTHRLVSRFRFLNEFFLWFNHALIGISGAAYRAFHMDHHRYANSDRDPEYRLLRRLSGARGWGYLLLPAVTHIAVNGYPFYAGHRAGVRRKAVRDIVALMVLHAGLCLLIGLTSYLTYVVAPALTSLAAVVVIRSICEHHGTDPVDRWRNTRTMDASPILGFLWSNTHYHLEHHLFPRVPYHKMPELRRLLQAEYARRRIVPDRGHLLTALKLFFAPHHYEASIR